MTDCSKCNGNGELACPYCSGTGRDKRGNACTICSGEGVTDCFNCMGTGTEERDVVSIS